MEANGIGDNGAPAYTQQQYDGWKREYDQADEAVRRASGKRRDLRKRIEGVLGKNGLIAFAQARKESLMPGADRVEIDEQKRRMLEWENKPLGYQQGFDLSTSPPPAMLNLDDDEIDAIKRQAYEAGIAGKRSDRNPWNPNSRPHEVWLEAWTEGQAAKVTAEIVPEGEQPRRGRPPGPGKKATSPTDGRKGRVVTEEQKAAMAAGRERARQAKAAAAAGEPAPASAEPPLLN